MMLCLELWWVLWAANNFTGCSKDPLLGEVICIKPQISVPHPLFWKRFNEVMQVELKPYILSRTFLLATSLHSFKTYSHLNKVRYSLVVYTGTTIHRKDGLLAKKWHKKLRSCKPPSPYCTCFWDDVDHHLGWDFGALACPFRGLILCAGSLGHSGA